MEGGENMATSFEVGKSYGASEIGFDPIMILKRSPKTLLVTNGQTTWRMRIRKDADGSELLIDSTMPERHRITYHSKWIEE